MYGINTVDAVTQYEHIGCVQDLRSFLLPVAEANRPGVCAIRFHTDNGRVHQPTGRGCSAKLHIGEFTKSRARKDNALVEGKNAASRGKHLGYDHIPQRWPSPMTCSPFLNHHRPCLFPTEQRDHKGKIKKRSDQDPATPYEKPMPRRSSNPPHLPTTRCQPATSKSILFRSRSRVTPLSHRVQSAPIAGRPRSPPLSDSPLTWRSTFNPSDHKIHLVSTTSVQAHLRIGKRSPSVPCPCIVDGDSIEADVSAIRPALDPCSG